MCAYMDKHINMSFGSQAICCDTLVMVLQKAWWGSVVVSLKSLFFSLLMLVWEYSSS